MSNLKANQEIFKALERIEKMEERGFILSDICKRQIEVEENLKDAKPEINGWKFETDGMSGTWYWVNDSIDKELIVFATLYHEDETKLPIEADFDAFCGVEQDDLDNYSEEFFKAPSSSVSLDIAYYLKKMTKVLKEIETLYSEYKKELEAKKRSAQIDEVLNA